MDPILDPVEAAPSADNGNIPVDAPSQQTPTEPLAVIPDSIVPATPTEPAPQPAASTDEFELPDGRKVDAATLAREWKENFYPEYTRKSQALAAQQQHQPALTNEPQAPTNKYADPNYIPQSYEEILAEAEQRAVAKIEAKQQGEVQRVNAIENQVTQQLADIKTTDPTLDETALFLHATKYGFQDLKAAHTNMKDMRSMAKTVQQQTAANIQKRSNEPVATTPGQANGTAPNPANFATARDFIRSLNK